MKIFFAKYSIKKDQDKINIFDQKFVLKYKHNFKIIHNNKIYPLSTEFNIVDKNIHVLNIKLLCYSPFFNEEIIANGCVSPSYFNKITKYKRNTKKYFNYLKSTLFELSMMVYNINEKDKEDKKVKIFGTNFVENNNDKCIIIYKDRIFPLKEYFDIRDVEKGDNKIEILLLELKDIFDRSSMFEHCESLEEFSFRNEKMEKPNSNLYSKEKYVLYSNAIIRNTKSEKVSESEKVYSTFSSFDPENQTETFSFDKSKWKTCNCKDMSSMFCGCSSLKSLPDISRWDTKNVTNMISIFDGCKSLKSISDISNWNLSKVSSISGMFDFCESLVSLPDISKWNTSNTSNMDFLFLGCKSLVSLPDISKWDTKNVKTMIAIFEGCSLLKSLPDISKWNTSNLTNLEFTFDFCSSLVSLPDISQWNIEKVTSMNNLFSNCILLKKYQIFQYGMLEMSNQ